MVSVCIFFVVFFFKQKTAYEMLRSLVGSEMCIRDRYIYTHSGQIFEKMQVVSLPPNPKEFVITCDKGREGFSSVTGLKDSISM